MQGIYHLRNATLNIQIDKDFILVDLILGNKHSMSSYTEVFHPQKKPTLALPENCKSLLKNVTHCLITHQHSDHLDTDGINFLDENKISMSCSYLDATALKAKRLFMDKQTRCWVTRVYFNGTIEGIPAVHDYEEVAELMGNVMGYFIKLPNHKGIHLNSDTIFTKDVEYVLKQHKPKLSILACGTARLDKYKPILMQIEDTIKFIKTRVHVAMANHLETVNHCKTSRKTLIVSLKDDGLNG